jgi:hypothetical protein
LFLQVLLLMRRAGWRYPRLLQPCRICRALVALRLGRALADLCARRVGATEMVKKTKLSLALPAWKTSQLSAPKRVGSLVQSWLAKLWLLLPCRHCAGYSGTRLDLSI